MAIGIFITVQHCVGAALIVLVAWSGLEGRTDGLPGLGRRVVRHWEGRPGKSGPGEQDGAGPQEERPGVGPQGEPSGAGKSQFRSWEEVAEYLGRLLRESGFEAYLAEGDPLERDDESGDR